MKLKKQTAEEVPLHVKYRPTKWKEVIGNEEIKKAIRATLDSQRFFLLHGSRGCGKTTIARLIGKTLTASDMGIIEYDAATNRGIDNIRQMKSRFALKPIGGKKTVYIIDECHRLTAEAQDALLKSLEEPDEHLTFVFCTTALEKVASTVRSRAAIYKVSKLKWKQMKGLVDDVCKQERIKISEEVKEEIILIADGISREALILLGQVRNLDESSALALIKARTSDYTIGNLCQVLLSPRKTPWEKLMKIMNSDEVVNMDAEEMRRAILAYFAAVARRSKEPSIRVCQLGEIFMDHVMDSGKSGLLFLIMKSYLLGGTK